MMSTNGIKFEAGFMQRNNRSVTTNNSVALTEFIANAQDAGAHNVNITIPDNENGQIIDKKGDNKIYMAMDKKLNVLTGADLLPENAGNVSGMASPNGLQCDETGS